MNANQVTQIATIVAAVLAQMNGKPAQQPKAAKKAKAAKPAYQPKADRKAAFADAVIAAFEKAGYGKVVPNQDVLTYGKWAELGLQPKEGSKAVHVKAANMKGNGIPLFHKSQCEALRNPA